MSQGWKTVETKRNRKQKKVHDSDYSDSEDEYGFGGSNTKGSPSTAAGLMLSAYHVQKMEAKKKAAPTRSEMAAAAAAEAEELAKRRVERKTQAADAARQKRLEAQAHAKRANDAASWPTVAEALAENSEAFMDRFDNIMDEDPIVSKGGIGALLAYAPSIFEKFTYRTRLLPEEASGEVLLTASLYDQSETYPEALDTFVYYKSLLSKMPEVKNPSPARNQSVCDGFLALLSAVWGTKGLKNALASKDAGRGGVLAVELTFEELWSQGLQHLEAIAAMFVNTAKGEANAPAAAANFLRIFALMVNGANSASDKEAGRIAIAKAAATLFTGGFLTPLFSAKDDDASALLDVMATAIRYVSSKQLTAKAFGSVMWKDAIPSVPALVKSQLQGCKLGSAWSVIGIEFLARPSATLAKTAIGPCLDGLEEELSGQTTFSPAENTLVVVLSTIFALHAAQCTAALKAHATKAPRATFVFLAVAKASKLFEVPTQVEEAIVAAAKKAGAQAPKMTNNVKVSDLPTKENTTSKKGAAAAEGSKKGSQTKEDGGDTKKQGAGWMRMLLSVAMMAVATGLVSYQANSRPGVADKKTATEQ